MIQIIYTCDRQDCDAAEESMEEQAAHLNVDDFLPSGWGWDRIGLDVVLHCADHRRER